MSKKRLHCVHTIFYLNTVKIVPGDQSPPGQVKRREGLVGLV